jgi:NAD-dependent DNA ligase
MLFNAGFKTITDLRASRPFQLISIPTIGREVAKNIYEQVGVTLDQKEWISLKSEKPTESQQETLALEHNDSKE